jgi:predicted CoA-binding protein
VTYNVAVLGASNNPDRYSYKALVMLKEAGYPVFPVHPSEKLVNGIECYSNLNLIQEPLDTMTVYLSERNSTPLIDDIISIHPRRIILNPGAENETLTKKCQEAGIQVQEACTLVLIRTGQF